MGIMKGWTAVIIFISLLIPGVALGDVFYWVDEKGVQYYTTRLENIPEPYRSSAETLTLPESPPPPPELQAGPPEKSPTRISFSPGSPVLVSARINGAGPVTLILDTGADRTLVSPSALSRLGISTDGAYRGVLKGVTGVGYADAVWVATLEVGEAKAGPLLVIAHDAGLKGADGLLGRDFLVNFNVTIDPKGRVVTLSPD